MHYGLKYEILIGYDHDEVCNMSIISFVECKKILFYCRKTI